VLFVYYCITISLTILEPVVCFLFHFYEIYTNCAIEDSDILIVGINLAMIIPRMLIQIVLSLFIADRFSLYLLMTLKLIEPIS
jgi:hypothetical protein